MVRTAKCPHCGHSVPVGDETAAAGKRLTCPGCKKTFALSAAPGTAVAPPTAKGASGTSTSAPTTRMARVPAAASRDTRSAPAPASAAAGAKGTAAPASAASAAKSPHAAASPSAARPATASIPRPPKGAHPEASPPPAKSPDKAPRPKPPAPPAVPPPVPTPWHLCVDGQTLGPFTTAKVVDQVRAGQVPADALAWKDGMADWQPLGEVAELAAALGAGHHRHKASGGHDHDREHEERHRHAPGRGERQDHMIALYGLCGLVAVGLIVVLLVMRYSKNEAKRNPAPVTPVGVPPGPPEAKVIYQAPTKASTAAAAEATPSGPQLAYPQLDNMQYFAKFKTDTAKAFQDALAGHKLAKAAPIRTLARVLKSSADELGRRTWTPLAVKGKVESLVLQLNESSKVITEALKDREMRWSRADGIDGPARSTVLELDKVAWLENWRKIILDDLAGRLREDGY